MIATVLIADGTVDSQGDTLLPTGVQFNQVVPLLHCFQGPPLGTARLFWEGNELKAEINVVNEELQKAIPDLFPAIGGRILEREGSLVTSSLIQEISVSHSPNADPRIKRVGYQ